MCCAEDIAQISEDVRSMNRMTEKIAQEATKMGLVMNKRKTKVMAVQLTENIRRVLEGEVTEEADWFEHLSNTVCKDGDVREGVGIRIRKDGAVFSNIRKVWTSHGIALETKMNLFNAIVQSILLHGSETRKGLKKIGNRLRIFESNCLRRIFLC